jgi:hypothetical protein
MADVDKMIAKERARLEERLRRTTAEEVQRQVGLAGRAAAPALTGAAIGGLMGGPPGAMIGAGVGSLAYPLSDLAVTGYNYLTGSQAPTPSAAAERVMTRLGVPEPETATERVVQSASRGAIDAITGAQGARAAANILQAGAQAPSTASTLLQSLAQAPGAQATSGALGGGVASTAAEMGAGPVTSMIAGTAAGVAPNVRPQNLFSSQATPNRQQMNAQLEAAGVPLSPAQQLASPSAATFESVMRYLPTSAARVAAMEDAQGRAWTQAINRQAGINAENALPETLAQRQVEFGQRYQALERATMLTPDNQFAQDLQQARTRWVRGLDNAQQELFNDTVDQLQAFVNARAQGATMAGQNYHMVDAQLRDAASSAIRSDNPNVQQYGRAMDNLRQSLQGLMERSAQRTQQTQIPGPNGTTILSGSDLADAWRETNRQYAVFSRIKDAMGSATGRDKLNTGFIPASALAQEERRSVGPQNYAMSDDPFTRLVRAGQAVLPDPVPNSGTAQRSFAQNILTGAGRGAPAAAAAGGAQAAGIAAIDPFLSLAIPYGVSRAWYARANPPEVSGLLGMSALRGASTGAGD